MGRPSKYSPEIADRICSELAEGKSLREICVTDDLPHIGTICRWVATNPEFREQYARAREAQAECLADELLEIADDGINDWMEVRNKNGECVGWRENGEAIRRSVLRVDTRKWIASKLLPKKYGDKIQQEVSGPDGGPVQASVTIELVKTQNCNGQSEG